MRRLRDMLPVAAVLMLLAASPAAAEPCANASGWDVSCLRRLYAAPLAAWPAPRIEGDGGYREMAPLSPPLPASSSPPAPADTVPEPLRQLGSRLFFDPALSASDAIACASCHRPDHAFADTQAISPGHDGRRGRRNAPALVGVAHAVPLFWDGRAPTLEAQALGPIADAAEMAMPLDRLPGKLAALPGYREDFAAAFGDGEVTLARIQSALATYQRTLVPVPTRFDDFLRGRTDALDDRELLGLHLFRTKARCMSCHNGPTLTDNRFHNLGLTYYGRQREDLGRYRVSADPADVGAFRTPTLRSVAQSGPWMHNGVFSSLRGILNLYNAGMPRPRPANAAQAADPLFPQTSRLLRPLELRADELQALEAFLRAL
ncbi:cytochrome-c peroxidase [Rhodocyclus tenuis]|uniref:cytochrome-c peroxidase n=1 Tax=Rhodocyclus tenuis TaxID=1066 RepID=UPI001F5B887E|nr:cytochrome c peroxidase [Rhodocyclus tenuis]